MGGLLVSALAITVVNAIFHFAVNSHRMGLSGHGPDALDLTSPSV